MGNHPTNRPLRLSKVMVVCELDRDVNDPPAWWRVTVSMPGREGTFTRTWTTVAGRLDQPGYEDLTAWFLSTFDSAIIASGGVQGSLLG